jgi:hypothetical protein
MAYSTHDSSTIERADLSEVGWKNHIQFPFDLIQNAIFCGLLAE